ncbi:hypothetical protein CO173_03555 [Candidatus Uhrbacteria bacterium CG_4_9_14_3_um_filter_41_35]|uniref:ATP-cone domain-containing protein n=1 Tax=Candidatus Uhrbacteria bacterium CG_4_9_14_3_um_filter_41_35 TaxID=1975034 RepID=A0A2M7XE30_9BACT|nr:MAG: hypothetical protein COV92_02600 [Candidatus Uhrbacteria bacterium CG11_big_fil_rev_8_21_14_0_20_41_9]PJA46140.1 MAG: hypothetical protein CO173_03555 [Candidatus Uhrbacteria bacterium CG_4_9_14_3_um_filter_41_35]
MEVIKSSGDRSPFSIEKVRQSMLRTGAKPALVEAVVKRVEAQVYDGISTRKLYEIVRDELRKDSVCYSCKYNIREGIRKMGPAGFKFEKYVASILNAYNYQAYVPVDDLEGSCVNHEVDVIAEKDNRRMFIEAKFRNDFRGIVKLKDTMATWSRFLDLVDGSAVGKCLHFDEVWLVTNARFSDRSRQYGTCKGLRLIGWDFPKDKPFSKMVDHLALYPVTVIHNLTQKELEGFAEIGMMLCREVAEISPDELSMRIEISFERAAELIELCEEIVASAK